jgi:mRNA-degrading endonuclease RelE of RelBE toxin-antitoxin system
MDKIGKFLKKLSKEERLRLKKTIASVLVGDIKNLDIKKLMGHDNTFRIRVGDIRIIFENKNESINLIFVGRKNEDTYKF